MYRIHLATAARLEERLDPPEPEDEPLTDSELQDLNLPRKEVRLWDEL